MSWFGTDEDCLDYLEWLRWPGGFTCPSCGHAGGWQLGDGRRECSGCGRRTSVAIWAELGDVRRFGSSSDVVRHTGLDITVHSSDGKGPPRAPVPPGSRAAALGAV